MTTTTYDAAGRAETTDVLVDETAGTHRVYGTVYDAAGRVWKQTSPLPDGATATTQRLYWPDGSLRAAQSPVQFDNHPGDDSAAAAWRTEYFYDPAGRTSAVQSPSPSTPGATVTSRSCYTARGELSASIDATGAVTAYEYFRGGQLEWVTDPLGMNPAPATGDPCAPGALSPVAGAKAGRTSYAYDLVGRRTGRTVWNGDLTAQVSESWAYPDELTMVHTDALNNTTTTTSAVVAGRRVSSATTTGAAVDPGDVSGSSVRTVTTGLTPSGAVATQTARHYASDETTVVDEESVAYAYDGAGRRSVATLTASGEPTRVARWGYDASGEVTTYVTKTGTEADQTLSAQWDLAGGRTQLTYPDGAKYRSTFDVAGRLATVAAWSATSSLWVTLATNTYDANGARTSESLASGSWSVRAWRYEPMSGVVGGYGNYVDGLLRGDTLGYDDNGRLASDCRISQAPEGVEADWDTCVAGVPKLEYGYDRAGQLTSAVWSDNPVPTAGITAWGYEYANRGTRSSATVTDTTGTHTTVYGYNDAAQLTAASSTTGGVNATYGYDKAGRRTSRVDATGTATSSYDPFGRLKGVEGTNPEYRYYGADGNLQAVSTNGPAQTPDVNLFWDPASPGGVAQVLDVTLFGSLRVRSAFAQERLNLDAGSAGQLWYSYDVAGSAIGDGQDYSPTGERIDDTPSNFFNYRGELNITPDLVHLRNRDYDPSTATFTTKDPLDGVDGTSVVANPYHYADNDPLNNTDPLGLRPTEDSPNRPCTCLYGGTDAAGEIPSSTFSPVQDYASMGLDDVPGAVGYWSTFFGIDQKLLATVLSHEGRMYINNWQTETISEWYQFYNQAADELLPGPQISASSVGLGQIQPRRAQNVQMTFFGTDFNYRQTGDRLIFNNTYSVALSAGVLFENCVLFMGAGATTFESQFLAYALDPTAIRAFSSVGWDLDRAERERGRLGLTQSTIDIIRKRRDVELPAAIARRHDFFGY